MSIATPNLRPNASRFTSRHQRTPTALAMAVTAALVAALNLARPAAAQLAAGDVIIDNGSKLQRYSAAGTLKTTYSTSGTTNFKGASITPSGNLVTTYSGTKDFGGGVLIYSPSGGTALKKFNTTAVQFPGDVSAFADGTLAINDQFGAVVEYSQTGSLIRKITVSTDGSTDLFGNAISPDNTLYTVDSGLNTISHYNETGTLLGSFVTSFGPTDLVVSPTDGTLFFAASGGSVYHTATDGTVLASFSSGVSGDSDGIGISGDGSTIYAVGYTSTTIRKLDSTTGAFVGSIPITTPGNVLFLSVVPNAAAAPEPGSVALAGLGLLGTGLGVLRRRGRCMAE